MVHFIEGEEGGAADAGPAQKKQKKWMSSSAHQKRAEILAQRKSLPVWAARDKLIELLQGPNSCQCLVLVGETGSGKTTQIPQFLYQAGLAREGAIAVTQPRRVAAVTVARRVAEEMGCVLGEKVGYTVRFDDTTSPATRIKYMTDGMLLREALLDPALNKYQVVIIDEAHERTVQTDVLLGLLKGVLQRRAGTSFRLLVMSATLEASKFVQYLPGSKAALVHGRTYPVGVHYTTSPEDSYLDAAMNATLQIHIDEGPGDILVFMTGQEEIEALERLLKDRTALLQGLTAQGRGAALGAPKELLVLPIYAALPPEQQMAVFEPAPPGTRKAILATNIAETSITISGVRYVVDSGMVKARAYRAALGADSLEVVPISQAQARQRSGRAGREAPGKAYRLYTEKDFNALEASTPPEILRSNLATVALQLKALGVADVLNFDFMDPPPRPAVVRALELLYALGALDNKGALTDPVGTSLAKLPVDPMFGKVLLASAAMGCAVEAMLVVSMVSTDGIWVEPRAKREEAAAARMRFAAHDGDHVTLLAVMREFEGLPRKQQAGWAHDNFVNLRSLRKAQEINSQLVRYMGQLGLPIKSCGEDTTHLRRALVCGLFPHAARRQPEGTYKVLATGKPVSIHPSSVLIRRKPECIVFNELVWTTKAYARDVCAIEARWLPELAPSYFAAKAGGAAAAAAAAGASGVGSGA